MVTSIGFRRHPGGSSNRNDLLPKKREKSCVATTVCGHLPKELVQRRANLAVCLS